MPVARAQRADADLASASRSPSGRCDLGTWQGVYLWEHRHAAARRGASASRVDRRIRQHAHGRGARFDKRYYDRYYRNPRTRVTTAARGASAGPLRVRLPRAPRPAGAPRARRRLRPRLLARRDRPSTIRAPATRASRSASTCATSSAGRRRRSPSYRAARPLRSDRLPGRAAVPARRRGRGRDRQPRPAVPRRAVPRGAHRRGLARQLRPRARPTAACTCEPPAWYRTRLARSFRACGGGVYLHRDADAVLYALEHAAR